MSAVPLASLPTGTVTLLFTDLEGSTRLIDELGEDGYAELLGEHQRLIREAIAIHGGCEFGTAGDAFFVAFADAASAMRCAGAAQLAHGARGPLRVRIGVHTGHPELRDGDYLGMDVHRVARLMSAAHGGQTVLSAATRAALRDAIPLRDLGEHRLKDLPMPERVFQLGHEDFPPLKSLNRSTVPLGRNPLVGRVDELGAALDLLLDGCRMVTLLGPGGAGKTRLALEVGRLAAEQLRDGAHFVALASLDEPGLVLPAVARALDLAPDIASPADALSGWLSDKQLLLVLDNCEQVLGVAPDVGSLLEAAPGLRVLATSREPLRVGGEHRLAIGPLPLNQAVALFEQRARAVRPEAGLPRADVVAICDRVDRLPLAVELAAARVNVLSPSAIARRLTDRFKLLVAPGGDLPERQRTLRATLDWSHELLEEDEKVLLRRLGVFVGPFTIEQAFAVGGDDALDGIGALVDKSLLRRARDPADGDPRFEMLQTIRDYAQERLAQGGEEREMRDRHAALFLELPGVVGAQVLGVMDERAFDLLEASYDEIRAAMDHLLTTDPPGALRLAAAIGQFWDIRGHHPEARKRIAEVLAVAEGPPDARMAVTYLGGRLAVLAGDREAANPLLEEGLELARELGDFRFEVVVRSHLAAAALLAGDEATQRREDEAALRIARESGDPWALGTALNNLGHARILKGDAVGARALLEEARALREAMGDRRALSITLGNLAELELGDGEIDAAAATTEAALEAARAVGYTRVVGWMFALRAISALLCDDPERAATYVADAMVSARRVMDPRGFAMLLICAACVWAARGQPLSAARLAGAADGVFELVSEQPVGAEAVLLARYVKPARASADAAAWAAAAQDGRGVPVEQVLVAPYV